MGAPDVAPRPGHRSLAAAAVMARWEALWVAEATTSMEMRLLGHVCWKHELLTLGSRRGFEGPHGALSGPPPAPGHGQKGPR